MVFTMIGILAGIAYPTFISIMERARKIQAANEEQQIITAVNAYYTEYGKYPLAAADTIYGPAANPNADLFYSLRAVASGANVNNAINTRAIVFISPPDVKNPSQPKSGIGTTSSTGQYFDPWGTPYNVEIDGNYDNQITNPYSDIDGSAGATPLRSGVIGWSYGSDRLLGTGGNGIYKDSDDVISWQ